MFAIRAPYLDWALTCESGSEERRWKLLNLTIILTGATIR